MRRGCLPGRHRFSDRRQDGRHAGADVRAQRQRDAGRQRHQALAGHHDRDTRGRGRRLHQPGEDGAHQDAEQRIFQFRHQFQERRVAAQRIHRIAHDAHAAEQQADPEQHGAAVFHLLGLAEKDHAEADGNRQHGILGHVECDDLGRHRAADVGAHDDPDRLRQGHDAGRDESHHQHGGDRGRVQDGGDEGAGNGPDDPVFRHRAQHGGHPVAGHRLEARRHLVDAEQEQRQSAEQAHQQAEPIDGVSLQFLCQGGRGDQGRQRQDEKLAGELGIGHAVYVHGSSFGCNLGAVIWGQTPNYSDPKIIQNSSGTVCLKVTASGTPSPRGRRSGTGPNSNGTFS